MFAVVLQNKHKEAQIKLYNSSNKCFANFPVLSVSESSIFGHEILICRTICSSYSSAMPPLCWYKGNQSY